MASFIHVQKESGDLILSDEWNAIGKKLESINAKFDEDQSFIKGDLSVGGFIQAHGGLVSTLSLSVEGNASISGTLDVGKTVDLQGRLTVAGATALNNSLTVRGIASLQNTTIAGTATVQQSLSVRGALSADSVTAAASSSFARDTNTASYLGRAAVGYCGHNDYAAFSHLDSNGVGGYALLQHNNGTTFLNAATGRTIHFRNNNIDKMTLNSAGNLSVTGAVTAAKSSSFAKNTNTASYLGRAAVGYCGHNDYAAFSHLDSNTGGGYALLQHNNGTTFLNAANGRTIHFRINNADKMTLSSTGNLSVTGTTNKLDIANAFTATVRCADFKIGHSGRRGTPGRALVDFGKILYLNYGTDWTDGIRYYGAWSKVSTRDIKQNIHELETNEAVDILQGLRPVNYQLKQSEDPFVHLGFVAEEVPRSIASHDGRAIINDHIVAVLTKVVQEQQQTIRSLTRKVDQLCP